MNTPPLRSQEHKKRVVTAIIALIFGGCVYFYLRQLGVVLLTGLIVAVATWEMLSLTLHKEQAPAWLTWKKSATAASAFLLYALLLFDFPWILILIYGIFFTLFAQTLYFCHRDGRLAEHLRDNMFQLFAIVYIAGFLSFVPAIHGLPQGPTWFVLLLISVWGGDIGAYYGGKLLGRHKLSLNLSPGKTWEGTICGLAFVTLLGALFTQYYLPHLSPWSGALIAVLTSIAAQVGDLLESLIKRVSGAKDSGKLFPGHGGAFDRFDSLILAAPLFHILAVFLS